MNVVSLDPGFGEVKVALKAGNDVLAFSFLSLVAEHTPTPLDDEKAIRIKRGNRSYVVGKRARMEPACRELYDFDDLLEFLPVFLEYALRKQGRNEDTFELAVISIPPGYWPERKRVYEVLSSADFENSLVVPQGQGGYWLSRGLLPEGCEQVLVLDLGYNTVDWLLIEHTPEDFTIVKGATLPRLGVMRLVDFFSSELKGKLGDLTTRVLREFLKSGHGTIYGERIDLRGPKARAEEKYADTLLSALKGAVGEVAKTVDAVIGIGGGTHYFDLKRLGHRVVVVPEKPEMANVAGQLEWALKQVQ